jgi:hypothetical protein
MFLGAFPAPPETGLCGVPLRYIPYGNASRPYNPLRVSYTTAFSPMIDRQ